MLYVKIFSTKKKKIAKNVFYSKVMAFQPFIWAIYYISDTKMTMIFFCFMKLRIEC